MCTGNILNFNNTEIESKILRLRVKLINIDREARVWIRKKVMRLERLF